VHAIPGGPPGVHAQFVFRGRPYHPIHFARPLAPDYYYTDYADVGLPPPDPGFEWMQYGPDLLLVNISTGEIVDVAYGVFY
jgi:hypothetical protein